MPITIKGEGEEMTPNKKTARLAGLLWLLMFIAGPIAQIIRGTEGTGPLSLTDYPGSGQGTCPLCPYLWQY